MLTLIPSATSVENEPISFLARKYRGMSVDQLWLAISSLINRLDAAIHVHQRARLQLL